jgi:hypothetical protein
VGAQTGLIWLRIGIGDGLLCTRDEPSGSIKCGEFLEQLRTFNFSRRTLLHGVKKHMKHNLS